MDKDRLKEIVKGEYWQAALQVRNGGSSCCSNVDASNRFHPIAANLNFFERYLTLWVGLCMVTGILLGNGRQVWCRP